MLLTVTDESLDPAASAWIRAALTAGVAAKANAGPVVGSGLGDRAVLTTRDRPTVVTVTSAEPAARLQAAAAAAAGVVWITDRPGFEIGPRLGLGANGPQEIPVVTVCVVGPGAYSDRASDSVSFGSVVLVSASPSRRCRRRVRRVGSRMGRAAAAPQRLAAGDGSASASHTGVEAARAALVDLMAEQGVEEFTIRGGQSLIVEYAGRGKEVRPSPYRTDLEMVEAARFLAGFSGDRSQRFDDLDPRLDIKIGDNWRLHAEGFVVSPPHMVLRSNMGGRRSLADLGLAPDALNRVLAEAVSGSVRANVVVAASMGGGKTTLCQALLATVDPLERIDTIEDTPELCLSDYGIHPNTYERLTRDANNDGYGRHSMADHIRDAKRANTSKLVVGEVRGEGTMALLDAMSSGINGCLVTLHSPPGRGVLEKLVAYASSEGAEPGYARRQIAIAVHLLVWLGRNHAGERVIADVTQITGLDEAAGRIETRSLWALRPGDLLASAVQPPVGLVKDLYDSAGVAGPGGCRAPTASAAESGMNANGAGLVGAVAAQSGGALTARSDGAGAGLVGAGAAPAAGAPARAGTGAVGPGAMPVAGVPTVGSAFEAGGL